MNFHEWTNDDGEVLILRRVPKSRKTYSGFAWPTGCGTEVECPDWAPEPRCGGGLHGWPWGFGLGDGSDYDIVDDIWLVVGCKPEDVVGELDGGAKCKFRRGVIRMEGAFGDAMTKVRPGFEGCVGAMANQQSDSGKSTVAGYYGKSTVAGNYGMSTVAGYSGKSTVAGDYGIACVDGENGCAAIAGHGGTVRVGERGAFALADWSREDGWRFYIGKEGENGIKRDVYYCVRDGKLAEA